MTLALHGKSRTRRTWLLAAALLAVVVGIGGSLMLSNEASLADPISTNFEAGFVDGSPNGQQNWSSTGSAGSGCAVYDHAIVTNSGAPASFGTKSLRVSNAVTSGCFGDQTFTPSNADEAGETLAVNGGMSGGTRQDHAEYSWDIVSTKATQQPGLFISFSPDRGDGARMSYLGVEDQAGGLRVNFFDTPIVAGPCSPNPICYDFIETPVATNLDRTLPHTLKLSIDFLDGPNNDVVKVYVDGVLKHTGSTWENYYRYDTESPPPPTRTVDSLLIRSGGTAVPSTAGFGYLVDNINVTTSLLPAPPTTTTVVEQEDLVTPPTPGWFFYDDNLDVVNNALGSMVAGPGTAPLGNGSAEVSTGAGGKVFLNTTQLTGPLANVTEIKYSTYTDSPAFPPFLNINVDFNLSNTWQNRLVFVPTGVVANTWQEHDAINSGAAMWSYSKTGFWPAPNSAVPNTTALPWSQIMADYPDIRVLPAAPQVGVRVGHPGPVQVSHIDKFVWGTSSAINVFDFDPGCTTICFVRKTGNDANDGSSEALAKLTIQAGIDAVNVGGTVNVGAGTYLEDVDLNKNGVQLLGAGIDQSIIMGPKGTPDNITLDVVSGANVLIDGFTITREGNNVADWNDANGQLNNHGVSFGTGGGGGTIQNSRITGNRNGILAQSTNGLVIQNNIIDNNRTGIHLNNLNTNTNIHNNFITNNWTMGVLLRQDAPLSTPNASTLLLNNNDISGNWYSQFELRANLTGSVNAENNWWGTLAPSEGLSSLSTPTETSGEEGYATQIPVIFGGTDVNPAGDVSVMWDDVQQATNPVDFTPWLCSGTDVAPSTIGFQPLLDCGDIEVFAPSSASIGDTNVQVQIRANSVENLWGVQTYLTYDQTRLALTGVQLGGGLDPDFVAVNTTSPGLISFAYSQTSGLPANGPSPVVIATLTFTATNTGAATIGYQVGQTQLFSNQLGQPMGPLNKVDGTILITNAPAVFGDIAGIILLQGRGNHSGATVQVDPPGGLISGPSNSSGSVSLTGVASGNHLIQASMLGYLNAVKAVFAVSAGTNSPNTVTLLGGDANMSGIINILDLSLVAAYFGQSPAYAPPLAPNTTPDINGDNVVNILDLSLTAANFGAVGPTSW